MSEQTLYFVKNPKMSDRSAGRKPVRVRKAGKTRVITEDDIATARNLLMPTAQQKLVAAVEKAQQRQRSKMFKPAFTPTEQVVRKQLLDQTIVQQQENKRKEDEEKAKLLEDRNKQTELRKAIMDVPSIMERVSQNHLLALERVAPEIAQELVKKSKEQKQAKQAEQQAIQALSQIPTIVEPTKKQQQNAQTDAERRAALEQIINVEGLTRPVDIANRYKAVTGATRMFQGYIDMVNDIKRRGSASGTGKGLDMEGAGFFDSLKNLVKKGAEKVVDIVKEDPIGTAKKAFELGQKAKGAYSKMFGKGLSKGGALRIPKKHQKMIHAHVMGEMMRRHPELSREKAGSFSQMFLKGLTAPFRAISMISKIPVIGKALAPIAAVADALPAGIQAVTGVKPLF